ncbi:unnamed protein product, partial [Amoebophrya sp. A25]
EVDDAEDGFGGLVTRLPSTRRSTRPVPARGVKYFGRPTSNSIAHLKKRRTTCRKSTQDDDPVAAALTFTDNILVNL